jgi:hypothetical protein
VSKNGLTIDTRNFNRAVKELSRLTGVKFEDVLKAEIGSILSQTITNTKKATRATIKKSLGDWLVLKDGGGKVTRYYLRNHWSNDLWQHIISSRDRRIVELIKRIGTAKKSWLLLANQMGITLPKAPPAYVAKALVNGKALTSEVSHTRKVSMGKVGFTIDNFTRAAIRGAGKAALLKAINGRTGYFYRNLRSGAFKKVAAMAKKYPGFKVRGI